MPTPAPSNQSVRAALAATHLSDFLAARSASAAGGAPPRPPLVTVPADATLADAAAALASARVLSAPVLTAAGSCAGVVEVGDVVAALLAAASAYGDLTDPAAVAAHPRLAAAELQTLAPTAFGERVGDVVGAAAAGGRGGPADLWFKHDKEATLLDVAVAGLRVGEGREVSRRGEGRGERGRGGRQAG